MLTAFLVTTYFADWGEKASVKTLSNYEIGLCIHEFYSWHSSSGREVMNNELLKWNLDQENSVLVW